MARRDPKAPQAPDLDAERHRNLTELSRAFIDPPSGGETDPDAALDPARGEARAEVELALSDLLSDDNGEIVLYNDSSARSLAIATEARVVDNGLAREHVTASGADVSGYRFITFDNGLTVFFDPELDLIVVPGQSRQPGVR